MVVYFKPLSAEVLEASEQNYKNEQAREKRDAKIKAAIARDRRTVSSNVKLISVTEDGDTAYNVTAAVFTLKYRYLVYGDIHKSMKAEQKLKYRLVNDVTGLPVATVGYDKVFEYLEDAKKAEGELNNSSGGASKYKVRIVAIPV